MHSGGGALFADDEKVAPHGSRSCGTTSNLEGEPLTTMTMCRAETIENGPVAAGDRAAFYPTRRHEASCVPSVGETAATSVTRPTPWS